MTSEGKERISFLHHSHGEKSSDFRVSLGLTTISVNCIEREEGRSNITNKHGGSLRELLLCMPLRCHIFKLQVTEAHYPGFLSRSFDQEGYESLFLSLNFQLLN